MPLARSIINIYNFKRILGKKGSLNQKWLPWFIIAVNRENVNKISVFVLAYGYVCVSKKITETLKTLLYKH